MLRYLKLQSCSVYAFLFLFLQASYAQNVGINSSGNAPDASSALDISFSDKGLLIPRVALTSTSSTSPITGSPANSLLVYNTATANDVTPGYYYWNSTLWTKLSTGGVAAASQWTTSTTNIYNNNTGNVAIGTSTFPGANAYKFLVDAGATTSYNLLGGKGSYNSYLQLNIQNTSAGTGASSDIVASNNAATESINFVDMGINSSTNNSTGVLGGANTAYIYSTGNDFFYW